MEFLSKTLDSSSFKEAVFENKETIPFKWTPPPKYLPLNNLSIYGYSIKKEISTKISIPSDKEEINQNNYITKKFINKN